MKPIIIFLISLFATLAATSTPVTRHQDGSITIDTSTLKASEGRFGPTPLIIHLDSLERVTGIESLKNVETPSYWRYVIDKLSHAWDGVPAGEVDSVKVDAISGATFSSESLISNVRTGIAYYLESKADNNSR